MTLITKAFYLMDTKGLPLSVTIEEARRRGGAVSLPHFYRDALAAGWKAERAWSKIEEALIDTGASPEYVTAAGAWLKTHCELPVQAGD